MFRPAFWMGLFELLGDTSLILICLGCAPSPTYIPHRFPGLGRSNGQILNNSWGLRQAAMTFPGFVYVKFHHKKTCPSQTEHHDMEPHLNITNFTFRQKCFWSCWETIYQNSLLKKPIHHGGFSPKKIPQKAVLQLHGPSRDDKQDLQSYVFESKGWSMKELHNVQVIHLRGNATKRPSRWQTGWRPTWLGLGETCILSQPVVDGLSFRWFV